MKLFCRLSIREAAGLNELGEPLHFDAEQLGERSFYKIRKTAID